MAHPWRLSSTSLVLGLALAACDVQGPGTLTDPGAEPFEAPEFAFVVGGTDCDGTPANLCAEAVIGVDGGTFMLGRSYLWIPPHSVPSDAVFRMQWLPDGAMDLSAALISGEEIELFNRVVLLGLEYDQPMKNPRRLRLYEVTADGMVEVPGSHGDPAKKVVSGWLRHFSQYVIASN